MRYTIVAVIASLIPICGVSTASEPRAVALEAVNELFVQDNVASFKEFVATDAAQGDRGPGTAVAKIEKQRPEHLQNLEVSKIIFFRKSDIDQLQASHPDDLWPRVRKHIGDRLGVLIKIALTGEAAERVRAAGKDPREVAMMTFVVSSGEDPKIVHIDDN